MKNLKKLFYSLVVTILSIHLYKAPPPPPGGGGGGTTPEAASSPIDMYWFVLAAIGLVIIALYAKKFKKVSA